MGGGGGFQNQNNISSSQLQGNQYPNQGFPGQQQPFYGGGGGGPNAFYGGNRGAFGYPQ